MLELAIEGVEGLDIETIELERKGISYTYDTMKLLIEKNPDVDYYFIIGADMVDCLPKWYKIDELIKMVSSPGGTTLAGLDALYEGKLTDVAKDACQRCTKRAYELSK